MHNHLNKSIIRIPLLGVNQLDAVRLKDISGASIRSRLKILCTPDVIEALFISSEEFSAILQNIIGGEGDPIADARLLDVWLTFVKYYTRMCSRCTPYGLMASVGVIGMGDSTKLQNRIDGVIHAQLDNEMAYAISHALEKSVGLDAGTLYFSNPSIYRQANKLKYIEVSRRTGNKVFVLSKIERYAVVEKILSFTMDGKNKRDILGFVQRQFEGMYGAEEIGGLIEELILNQLLLSHYHSSSTRKTHFSHLVENVEGIPSTNSVREAILKINQQLNQITKLDWHQNKGTFYKIGALLKDVEGLGTEGSLFHLNFKRSFSGSTINTTVASKARAAVGLVASINESYVSEDMELFKNAFIQRYEGRSVSLTEVLDEEIGIGYPVGNIRNSNVDGTFDGIKMPDLHHDYHESASFKPFHKFLFNKIADLKLRNEQVLHLDSDELKKFANTAQHLPKSFSVICSLIAEHAEDIDGGDFKISISNCAYTTAISPINRFSVSDSEIESLCTEIIGSEEELFEDCIVAEVLHIPNSRLENITFRKVTRAYEIPIEVRSANRPDKQIILDDILVNVFNNEVRLTRRQDGKRIIPRISNSHIFTNPDSLPAYRFLGDVQMQNQQNHLMWQWGPLASFDFLPRVVLDQHVICCLATWRVTLDRSFFAELQDLPDRLKLQLFNIGIPRYASIRQNGDNLLLVDLEDLSCLLILIKEFKKHGALTFHEYLQASQNPFVRDQNGNSYVNELIIPFIQSHNKSQTNEIGQSMYRPVRFRNQRAFFPGDRFLYLKIYCTKNIAQVILLESLAGVLLEFDDDVNPAFFIRYEDPEFHIRVRVHKEENASLIPLIYKKLQRFVKNKFIHKIQIDTYFRELDRYTVVPYYKTEQVFSADSKAVLRMLKYLKKINQEHLTWVVAIKNIHAYLTFLGMGPQQMLDFCLAVRNNFFLELKLENKDFLKSMNAKLKSNFHLIEGILSETDPEHKALYRILSVRSTSLSFILSGAEVLRIRSHSGQASSYIHMSLNRLFAADERFKEAMCYDLLYNFLVAIGKVRR